MKKLIKSNLLLQVIVASLVATLATAGIVGAVTTIGSNINTAGTLDVTGLATLLGGATTTTVTLLNGEIISNATDGTISFGDANLTFSGNASTTGSGVLRSATINSDTGAISFGDE